MLPVEALVADSVALMLVLTTEADHARAQALAEALLKRRLVACVSLQPLQSLYRWKGELQREKEVQLLLKTSADQLGRLQEAVMQLHSYDTPEWLSWPAEASAGYGTWALEQLSSDGLLPGPGLQLLPRLPPRSHRQRVLRKNRPFLTFSTVWGRFERFGAVLESFLTVFELKF